MTTERELDLNLWRLGFTVYQKNVFNAETGELVLRVLKPLPGKGK